jgi:hypothetical protein
MVLYRHFEQFFSDIIPLVDVQGILANICFYYISEQ